MVFMKHQYDADRGIHASHYYDGLTAMQKDELIVKLRRQGLSQAKIGKRLGLTQQGISKAIRRISEGRLGRDPRAE
jgi:DNA-binding CsgD family transcriptional regulator